MKGFHEIILELIERICRSPYSVASHTEKLIQPPDSKALEKGRRALIERNERFYLIIM